MLNEFSFQFSGNAINSEYGDNVKNTRSAYGINIPELFPENREGLIPTVAVTGLSSIGAPQLFDNKYRNYTVADNLSYQPGNHTVQGRLPVRDGSRRTRSPGAAPRAASASRGPGDAPRSRTS